MSGRLKHGVWKTSSELVKETGRTYVEVMDELFSSTNREKFLMVTVPTNESIVIYGRATPETRTTANAQRTLDIMNLPWALKRSAAKKVDELYRRRMTGSCLPEWMRAVLSLEERLVSAGLHTPRCRPREGFLYQCSWRVDYPPNTLNFNRRQLGIDFIGTAHVKTSVRGNDVVHLDTNDLRCWITLRRDSATLMLSGVAFASLKTCPHEFIHVPSRRSIIASTKELLQVAMKKEARAVVFMPIQPEEFKLLSTNEPHTGEEK